MRVWIDQSQKAFEVQNLATMDQYWKELTSDLFRNKKMIHYIEIDEIAYYDEVEKIIVDNFDNINDIKVVTITANQALADSKMEVFNYNARLLKAIDEIVSSFYGSVDSINWDGFSQFMEGINWLYHASKFVNILELQYVESKESYINSALMKVESVLPNMISQWEQFMKEQSFIDLADSITYELIPILEQISEELSSTGEAYA